jgi:hypothetical protein
MGARLRWSCTVSLPGQSYAHHPFIPLTSQPPLCIIATLCLYILTAFLLALSHVQLVDMHTYTARAVLVAAMRLF